MSMHPTKQEVRISKERELMALFPKAIAKSLKEQTLIPDALENLNLPFAIVKKLNDFTTGLYYEKRNSLDRQLQVADHQVSLTKRSGI